jgi:acetylornithine deacetylase/succinyl-diaminopimelate desuccinylase-like protein
VGIPSVAFPGYPPEPVHQMADEALRLFQQAGFANAELQQVPAGYPPVYGEIPGPEGAPTVMLYAHYDVQPAPLEQGWTSDPGRPRAGPTAASTGGAPPTTRAAWRSTWAPSGPSTGSRPAR